jgi:hypothetical protein
MLWWIRKGEETYVTSAFRLELTTVCRRRSSRIFGVAAARFVMAFMVWYRSEKLVMRAFNLQGRCHVFSSKEKGTRFLSIFSFLLAVTHCLLTTWGCLVPDSLLINQSPTTSHPSNQTCPITFNGHQPDISLPVQGMSWSSYQDVASCDMTCIATAGASIILLTIALCMCRACWSMRCDMEMVWWAADLALPSVAHLLEYSRSSCSICDTKQLGTTPIHCRSLYSCVLSSIRMRKRPLYPLMTNGDVLSMPPSHVRCRQIIQCYM